MDEKEFREQRALLFENARVATVGMDIDVDLLDGFSGLRRGFSACAGLRTCLHWLRQVYVVVFSAAPCRGTTWKKSGEPSERLKNTFF